VGSVMTVFRKEMRAYLVSPIPYVFVVIFAAFMALWVFFVREFFLQRQATMDSFFGVLPFAFIFIVPSITMRLWSEEARAGTLETLMTMPVKAWHLVAGKFLAAWALLAVCLVATAPIVVTIASRGDLDMGPVWGGYLGALFMGGALLALGMWVSALTRHQMVAFLVTMIAGFVLVAVTGMAAEKAQSGVGSVIEQVSVAARYKSMGRGVVDLRDLVYFVTFTSFFLYLNAQAVENRRYR
jgi:ABC-2 type transport system permease protein